MTTSDKQFIEEVRAREAKATRAPWIADPGDSGYVLAEDMQMTVLEARGWGYLTGTGGRPRCTDQEAYEIQIANAQFAAHARQDIPRLLSIIESSNAEIQRLHRWESTAVTDLLQLQRDLTAANAELEKMREALEWYANRLDTRCTNEDFASRAESCREAIVDSGYLARAALLPAPPKEDTQ